MRETEIAFYDLFKSVDNICRDMFREDHCLNENGSEVFGFSAYIRLMETERSPARFRINDWDSQIATLKELRRIRNRISHDPGDSGCTQAHLEKLNGFYRELMTQTDPLAVVYQADRHCADRRQQTGTTAIRWGKKTYADHMVQTKTPPVSGAQTGKRRNQRRVWFALGIAAAVLLIMLLLLFVKIGI